MPVEEIRGQVARILATPHFSRSQMLTRFLRFIVELTVEGKASELKEYRLGVDVFDRGEKFDPRIDPIVRLQAAKLRSRLAEYYSIDGRDDVVLITVPKGSYIPSFERIPTPHPAGAEASIGISSAEGIQSIAVLPFANFSANPENEFFSDGLTEEVINVLTSVPGLRVVARTSVFCFKGAAKDVREIGATLGVRTVLEGSVRRAGDQLRVTFQLIDVKTGYHLLSRTYQRQLKDVFALQDELARAVVAEIMPGSQGGQAPPATKSYTTNLAAYDLYLKGMFALSSKFVDLPQSIQLFRQALQIEPNYAPAWAGLAECCFMLAWFYMMPAEEAMPRSREAALKTLELDERLAQGHSSLGLIMCVFDWNWPGAETQFQRAIELQPGLAKNYQYYPFLCLLPQRRYEAAIAMVQRGLLLDPYNAVLNAIATYVYAGAARYQDAIRQHRLALDIGPHLPTVWATGGLAYELQGQMGIAIEAYRKACQLSHDAPGSLSNLGHALATSGDRREPREILKHLTGLAHQPAVDIARVCLGLGQEEEALEWLGIALEHHDFHLITAPMDRRFSRLQDHPRFHELLHCMGLAAASTAA